MKKKLCCIFNYPPAYRESIYLKIDEEFETQFIWSETMQNGKVSDIKRLDYSKLKNKPIINSNYKLFGHIPWSSKVISQMFGGYDAFIFTSTSSFAFLPLLLFCRIFNKPIYAWGHGQLKFSSLDDRIFQLYYHLMTGFLCYSEQRKQRLVELGVPDSKIHVIYNSLTPRINSESKKDLKSDVLRNYFNNDYPTLVFVGRLTFVKKLEWLIEALKHHKLNNTNYNLLLIGDGPMRSKLEALADKNGLRSNIWFYGECYDDNILNELIYNSDLCVSPGNVGLTALHSMIYGTPVLSHDSFENQMPEYETIVEGFSGSLYKNGDFDDFCLKIESWLNANHDRNCIRNNCYSIINDKWNSDYQIEIVKNLI